MVIGRQASGVGPGPVRLAGQPVGALEQHTITEGCRGDGLAELLLGSRARRAT